MGERAAPGPHLATSRGFGPTLREFLDLAENNAGVVDGNYATDHPCPGADVHEAEGPGPYTPSEKLKAFLRVKHRICIFPGCQRQ